ncbi:MAG TPA: GNAT family N-acetyltransferase [Anaerolineae bacterium]|nr:GNAT family N-acetyltransferase [Anaerolineae bacterium]
MNIRPYNPQNDRESAHRIWQEVGWVSSDTDLQAMDIFLDGCQSYVTTINDEAECLVAATPGTIQYLDERLPLTAIMAVTTSRIARKQRLASRLTAHAIAQQAAEGAYVAALGIFDQGFYNQLGFGNGRYVITAYFDPANLTIPTHHRIPQRFTADDWQAIHTARLNRTLGHAACNITSPNQLHAEILWSPKSFGLGYTDDAGNITHHFWAAPADDVENGPYHIWWLDYQTPTQLRELLSLVKSLGDQVRLVRLEEPRGVQIQDFLNQPFRNIALTNKSKYENRLRAIAYWQMRICDLAGCLTHTHLPGPDLRFNLSLTDPITQFLPDDTPWHGVHGDFTITLGPTSAATPGHTPNLPLMTATINAFTRLWLGIRPPSGLAISDTLNAPPSLLTALDQKLRLPTPITGWDF